MNPEDVPEELLSLYGRNYMGSSSKVAARRAMAAVIPEIEKRVRERVAAETRDLSRRWAAKARQAPTLAERERREAMANVLAEHAERIARGES